MLAGLWLILVFRFWLSFQAVTCVKPVEEHCLAVDVLQAFGKHKSQDQF